MAKAQVGVAQASIGQAQALLNSATTDLGYTEIKSPVKGVIVDRRVNVGQTQVSALSASSLFLLAKDLGRVQIWASVNEADIGRIHTGQKATFTVDTFPGEAFQGVVSQVRLNATMTQNVVTYTVVVTTENKDMRLLPYMTANVNFEIEHHDNVLKVPNAALRWKPRPQQIAPEVRADALAAMNNRHGDKSKKGGEADQAAEESSDGGKSAAKNPGTDDKSRAGRVARRRQARSPQRQPLPAALPPARSPRTGRPVPTPTRSVKANRRRAERRRNRTSHGRRKQPTTHRRARQSRQKTWPRRRSITIRDSSGRSTAISSGRSKSRSSPRTAR